MNIEMAYESAGKEKYNGYYAMQDMTPEICNAVTRSAYDEQATLIDKRDNKTYTVAKLKMTPDGSQATCWMSQNLALELSTSKTLTNEDTDLNSVTSWTPSRNTLTNVSQYAKDNNTPYSYNPNNASYGVYYNWSAAVASNNTSSMTTQYTNAPDSICPKGWRLPKIYDGSASDFSNEYGNLIYSYNLISSLAVASWASNGYAKIQQAPINSSLAGYVSSGTVYNSGVYGYYWSSSVYSDTHAYSLGFTNTVVNPQGRNYRNHGVSVRCVLR